MTLTEAELNYPWEGVTFVAVDNYDPEIIYVAKRYKDKDGKIQTMILSTETAMDAFGPLDGVKVDNDDSPKEHGEDVTIGKIGATLQRAQPTGRSTVQKIMDICQLNWKVVRSLQMGLPF